MKTITPYLFRILYAIIVTGGSYLIWRILRKNLRKALESRAGKHVTTVSMKLISYTLAIIVLLWVLGIFGVSVGSLFTALGLFSVAVGFAAQTSVSNLISGIFLLFDKPFEIGDAVDVGGQTGVILSIDLLSTKMRTFDNILVRIPNEAVLKSTIKNFVRFDIRRIEVTVGISYSDNISKAKQVIRDFVSNHPLVLAEPAPSIWTTALGDSSVNLKVLAWVRRKDMFVAKDSLIQGIKESLDAQGIEIPFPQLVVYFPEKDKDEKEANKTQRRD